MKLRTFFAIGIALLHSIQAMPVSADVVESPFTATFLQGWLCRDWTVERWNQEFAAAKAVGFDALILQSVLAFLT